MSIITIDFEASCLPRHGRSFPIEVGIATHYHARSWLIRPHESWSDWDWTEEAQRLHGLTRERLFAEGLPVEQVAHELLGHIDGHRIVADSSIDQLWLNELMFAAGIVPVPAIEHVSLLMGELGVTDHAITQATWQATRLCPERHRAGSDARWLHAVISTLCGSEEAHARPFVRTANLAFGAG